jgi:hypothetical protein
VKSFACPACGQLVFFDNTACLRCGARLGVDSEKLEMVVVDADSRCANHDLAGCNWLPAGPGALCVSCRLTRTRPADGDAEALAQFAVAEAAKRRLVFQLLALGLPVAPRDADQGTGVAFDLLGSTQTPVTTGHAGGVITLDLAESDDVHREQVRAKLREPYRTVLGHFRHEIGHYYFPVLIGTADGGGLIADARRLFGDETSDYQAALDRHYRDGAPAGWAETHISEYATMHPAEDWAETFAHYLHIGAVLETAAAYRVRVDGPDLPDAAADSLRSDPVAVLAVADRPIGPAAGGVAQPVAARRGDTDDESEFGAMIEAWLPLRYALNAITRSMGDDDLYPFVLPAPAVEKLAFVHRIVRASNRPGAGLRRDVPVGKRGSGGSGADTRPAGGRGGPADLGTSARSPSFGGSASAGGWGTADEQE